MKLRVLMFSLVVLVGACIPAFAAVSSHGGTIYPGWNFLALDGVPLDPSPANVFAGVTVNNLLYRIDPATKNQWRYDEIQPDLFGGMLLGDGYWLLSYESTPVTYSYQGLDDTDDMDIWVSLPTQGWSLIGNPFSYNYPWELAKVTDGNVTVSMQTAAKTNFWLNSIIYRIDSETQNQIWVGIPDDAMLEDALLPKNAYWINTYQDKLALILEAIP